MNEHEIKFFKIEDDIYPENLKNIDDAPQKLFYIGDINLLKEKKLLSIVGTRNYTSYGKFALEKIVPKLVENNVVIVSGLAFGIDSLTHEMALKNNGKVIAVVANGLDSIYPAANFHLFNEIAKKGLILSEYEIGTKAMKYNFPRRNRIIAGLSKATLLIESKEKGGSLITADYALEYGREVYAVPGDIFSSSSKGCNNLIKKFGAKLLDDADELLKDLNWYNENEKKSSEEKNDIELDEKFSDLAKEIYSILDREKTLDEIISLLNKQIDNNSVLVALTELEIFGLVKSVGGAKYKKVK